MAAELDRSRSVLLKVDGDLTLLSVIERLQALGISPKEHLDAVQTLFGRSFDITFRTEELKRQFTPVINGSEGATVTSYSDRIKIVNVIKVPFELNDNVVRYVLGNYGKVLEGRFQQMKEYPGLRNGTRQYKIKLEKDIPSSIRFGGRSCWVRYQGQPRTCLSCGENGHVASECNNVKCFKCLKLGHTSKECQSEIVCQTCNKVGHGYRDCPISFANVARSQSTDWVAGEAQLVQVDNEDCIEIVDAEESEQDTQDKQVANNENENEKEIDQQLESDSVEDSQVDTEGELSKLTPDTPVQNPHRIVTKAQIEPRPREALEAKRKVIETEDEHGWVTPKRVTRGRKPSPDVPTRQARSQSREAAENTSQRARSLLEQSRLVKGDGRWLSCQIRSCGDSFHSYEDLLVHMEQQHQGEKMKKIACPLRKCRHYSDKPQEWADHLAVEHPDFVLQRGIDFFNKYFFNRG